MAEDEKGGETAAEKSRGEVVSVELPAPAGWTKKFMPNEDGTPRRNEIVFMSPTGEEIKNKRQLQQYLKATPGGPTSSEFDWGTGDTPRRSARIREKVKAVETPEEGKPKKRRRTSSSKKGTEDKNDGDGVDGAAIVKEDVAADEAKGFVEVEMEETGIDENKVTDETVAVGTQMNDSTSIKVQLNMDTNDENKDADEGVAVGTEMKDGTPVEVQVNKDTSVVIEGEAEKQTVGNSNGSIQDKTKAIRENNGESTPGVDITVSVAEKAENKDVDIAIPATETLENIKSDGTLTVPPAGNRKEESAAIEKQDGEISSASSKHMGDAETVVLKEVPSASRSDGQHLPKASPVNC